MKKPTPVTADTVPAEALPQTGGSWIREADGTLRLEEATDSRPEAIAAALEAAANSPVKEV
jgi:hypothetical protein